MFLLQTKVLTPIDPWASLAWRLGGPCVALAWPKGGPNPIPIGRGSQPRTPQVPSTKYQLPVFWLIANCQLLGCQRPFNTLLFRSRANF
jgi:hypothetical protein